MKSLSRSKAASRPNGSRLATLILVSAGLSACSDLPFALETPATASPPSGESHNPRPGRSPIEGARFFADPLTPARRAADAMRRSRPADAALLEKIASQPQAAWVGDWFSDTAGQVRAMTDRIMAAGALPVFVLYNIPQRDCGQHSAGGAPGAGAYRGWIADVAHGLGGRRSLVILEPDALAGMDCLSADRQRERSDLLLQAVRTLKAAGTLVYLDAGNAGWHPADVVAARLTRAGIAEADGFALNVAQYIGTGESISFGSAVSARVGGKHFVIDTGRNGRGAAAGNAWCNAADRALGPRPTTATGHALVDAFLWVKNPGESDGPCNGGPAAGEWWTEYALGLARRAGW